MNKYVWAEAEVARESDMGSNDVTYRVTTALGNLLSAGDVVLGYDLTTTSYEHQLADATNDESNHRSSGNVLLPDVVLVQKVAGVSSSSLPNHIHDDNKHDPQSIRGASSSSVKQQRVSKAKQRRRVRKEGKRRKELEEAAVRMGFFEEEEVKEDDGVQDVDEMDDVNGDHVEDLDAELEEEVEALERDLAMLQVAEASTVSEAQTKSTDEVEK
jgi:nonsense-mediated mRNA decay protein 3